MAEDLTPLSDDEVVKPAMVLRWRHEPHGQGKELVQQFTHTRYHPESGHPVARKTVWVPVPSMTQEEKKA